jgi:hypothetical protein
MATISPTKTNDGYRVPQRFSIAEILAMMTVFSVVFGLLRRFDVHPAWYLFLGVQGLMVCLVQMWFGTVPRGSSTLLGSVLLPMWIWLLAAFGSSALPAYHTASWIDVPFTVMFGGLLGYCTGALAAGVFLVLDLGDDIWRRAAERRIRRV